MKKSENNSNKQLFLFLSIYVLFLNYQTVENFKSSFSNTIKPNIYLIEKLYNKNNKNNNKNLKSNIVIANKNIKVNITDNDSFNNTNKTNTTISGDTKLKIEKCKECKYCCYNFKCQDKVSCNEIYFTEIVKTSLFTIVLVLCSLTFIYKVYYTSELPEQTNLDKINETILESAYRKHIEMIKEEIMEIVKQNKLDNIEN